LLFDGVGHPTEYSEQSSFVDRTPGGFEVVSRDCDVDIQVGVPVSAEFVDSSFDVLGGADEVVFLPVP